MNFRWRSVCVVMCCLSLACGDDDSPADSGGDVSDVGVGNLAARRAALMGMVDGAVLPILRQFETDADALVVALDALVLSQTQANLEAAQSSWRAAIATWQRAELMQVGPAGAMDLVAGGQDMRDNIYSWPILDPCRVDQELVSGDYEDEVTFADENINVRGLYAMEYLLFSDSDENACEANRPINLDGSWSGIASELPQRRASYARNIARLVKAQASALVGQWDGGFRETVVSAGAGSDTYSSVQEGLNAFSDALFYLDRETKDMKLAEPAGISDLCTFDSCPSRRESKFANASAVHVAENLRGMLTLLKGGELNGFDDLLIAVGAEDVWVRLMTAIEQAIAVSDAFDSDFETALATDATSLDAMHAAVRAVTDLLKSEFISTLDLELPQRVEGDND